MARWSVPFEKIARDHEQNVLDVIQKSSMFLFSLIILRSPVDTGRFRANWNSSIGSMNESTSEVTDKSGSISIASAEKAILALKLGDIVFMANALPYAQRLEYGWSQQAPTGMVRNSAFEFQLKMLELAGVKGGRGTLTETF